jgi:STE24 endopeptidase
MQYNVWFFGIVLGVFLMWKLDLIVTLLNLKSLGDPIPVELAGVVDAEAYAKSQDYTREKAVLGIGEGIFTLLVLFVFWWLGGFGWLDEKVRAFAEVSGWRGTSGMIFTGICYIGLLVVALQLLAVPFDLYRTFGIEERYGFNQTTFATWCLDQGKGAVLGVLLGVPLLAAVLWIFESVPMAWLWGWLLVTAFSLLLSYVAPTWIMPWFNRFEPLPDGELKEEIYTMARQCNFPLTDVSVMDGSKRSSKSNAFFTGFGKNKRIALFDTLIERHTTAELVAVLAHEIGHYQKKHIIKGMALGILTTGAMFLLLGIVLRQPGIYAAFGVKTMSPYVGFVLFAILFGPVSELLQVMSNVISRKHEFEADAYAAEVTGDGAAMGDALKKLSKNNLSHLTPHPWYVFWHATHPPVVERIRAIEAMGAGQVPH